MIRSFTLLAAFTATFGIAGGVFASTADSATKTTAGPGARKAAYVDSCARCDTRACARDGARTATSKGQANASHASCSPQLGMRYFPAEEQHLAAYLDAQRCQPD